MIQPSPTLFFEMEPDPGMLNFFFDNEQDRWLVRGKSTLADMEEMLSSNPGEPIELWGVGDFKPRNGTGYTIPAHTPVTIVCHLDDGTFDVEMEASEV